MTSLFLGTTGVLIIFITVVFVLLTAIVAAFDRNGDRGLLFALVPFFVGMTMITIAWAIEWWSAMQYIFART